MFIFKILTTFVIDIFNFFLILLQIDGKFNLEFIDYDYHIFINLKQCWNYQLKTKIILSIS